MSFQSTPPIRVATRSAGRLMRRRHYFNPRHPYGWRLSPATFSSHAATFQSTPPIRVATQSQLNYITGDKISIHATHTGGDGKGCKDKQQCDISIHATHTGGDAIITLRACRDLNFNPRHPYGWRPGDYAVAASLRNFNPRHPYGWRRDGRNIRQEHRQIISIHATHTGGDCEL